MDAPQYTLSLNEYRKMFVEFMADCDGQQVFEDWCYAAYNIAMYHHGRQAYGVFNSDSDLLAFKLRMA